MDEARDDCAVIELTPAIAAVAGDVAEHHGLRGYDAVHLATAIRVAAEVLVCADRALLQAARTRGLAVIDARV